ncbi:hypothetical protein ABIF38_006542 [Bradyrhizobium japonicum]|uniref:hypothetical protein n=1 Tax=Bradyrhizobium elkanii TaxID=29448 RepID=UPI000368D63C|nr:hypothetical protein [Bradyrhizobium elkanii]MBP2426621.1 hypothetical protein [Bradyrhizobium elkanii]MCP1731150.1 hypothetical protein [Bradyrhizobium elkanii]MCP1969767.1 hypothetical protein [Bradyrhizobium elkanii]MCS3516950.1 hypothetical protein [Bradyrhizobium elkanii]MCS3575279.1 hypothetical protein [Bradyrhizobium elkanii]
MKSALLALSLVGQPPVQISDSVPNFDIKALCADVSVDDKASGLPQDASKCVSDETVARQQLNSIWLTVPAGPRESCELLAGAGQVQSYVELLVCLKMIDWDSPSTVPSQRPKQGSKALGN